MSLHYGEGFSGSDTVLGGVCSAAGQSKYNELGTWRVDVDLSNVGLSDWNRVRGAYETVLAGTLRNRVPTCCGYIILNFLFL